MFSTLIIQLTQITQSLKNPSLIQNSQFTDKTPSSDRTRVDYSFMTELKMKAIKESIIIIDSKENLNWKFQELKVQEK